MLNVDIMKAGDCLPELVAQTIGGNEVVITRNGQPVVKLVALTGQKRKRRFGSAKGLIRMSDDFDEPLEDFKDYIEQLSEKDKTLSDFIETALQFYIAKLKRFGESSNDIDILNKNADFLNQETQDALQYQAEL